MTTYNILSETLKNIDWNLISKQVSFYSHFEITKTKFVIDPKIFSNHNIDKHLDTIASLTELVSNGIDLKTVIFSDINDSIGNHQFISNIEKDFVGDFTQLNFVCCIIENVMSSKSILSPIYPDLFTDLHNRIQKIRSKFISPLRRFVDKDGSVHLEKHPLLAQKISEINSIEAKIRDIINKSLRDPDIEKRLQFSSFDIINDRYVIPIKSDSYQASLGIIVSRSSTGSTLFVEPILVRDLCNKRMLLISEVDEIINRICRDFCQILNENLLVIKDIYAFIINTDYDLSQSIYSYRNNFSRPDISVDNEEEINNFFHPLIDNCVKNSIFFTRTQAGLIISGPNTGGKTVAIKSIVLSHVFLKLGFFVPASSAKLRFVEDIFYFDSDYQNLSNAMSSFAGESTAILKMLAKIKDNSLVAADEIFNSTGSDEASALAISILNYLYKVKNSTILISTHHQLLKTTMQENENFVSAHVGYDFDKNIPSYRLITGSPGSSMALSIFEKLSSGYDIPYDLLTNAKSILDTKYITYERLLQDLSSKKTVLDNTLNENKELNIFLKNQKKSMEGVLFLEKKSLFENFQKKIEKEYQKIISIKNNSELNSKSKQRIAGEIRSSFGSASPIKNNQTRLDLKRISNPEVGKLYYCDLLKNDCTLTSISKSKATVSMRGKTITVPLNTLFQALNNRSKNNSVQKIEINVFRDTQNELNIDARGMRLEKFQNEIMASLPDLLNGNIPYLSVVHGHGEGILKTWLRKFLKSEKDFSWEPDEGNDGCTRITINQST